jgi:hypothetical protein
MEQIRVSVPESKGISITEEPENSSVDPEEIFEIDEPEEIVTYPIPPRPNRGY